MDNSSAEKGPRLAKVGQVVRKIFHEQSIKQRGIHSSAINPSPAESRGLLSKIANFIGTQDNRLRAASGEDFARRSSLHEATSPWSGEMDKKLDELAVLTEDAGNLRSISFSDLADIFTIQINSLRIGLSQQQRILDGIHPNNKNALKRVRGIMDGIQTDKELIRNMLRVVEKRALGSRVNGTELSIVLDHVRTQATYWQALSLRMANSRPELVEKYHRYSVAYWEMFRKLDKGEIQANFSQKRRFMLLDEAGETGGE